MEQKRTLWIIAAVGIFLLAVLGAALILYSPAHNNNSVVSSLESNTNAWINPNNIKDNDSIKPQDPTQIATPPLTNKDSLNNDENTVTELQLSEKNSGTAPSVLTDSQTTKGVTVYSENTTVVTRDGTTTFDISKPKTEISQATTVTTPSEITKEAEKTVAKKTAATVTTSKTESNTTVKSKPITNSSSSIKKETKPTVSTKITDAYWVQAASYTNKLNAEDAREALLKEEIPGEVFTHEGSDGITYYRLRVGPYTTKSEAEYWNERIKLINKFAKTQSYVTNSSLPAK